MAREVSKPVPKTPARPVSRKHAVTQQNRQNAARRGVRNSVA